MTTVVLPKRAQRYSMYHTIAPHDSCSKILPNDPAASGNDLCTVNYIHDSHCFM